MRENPLNRQGKYMSRDSDYCRRRAAEARSAAFCKESGEEVEVAGNLALAYSAIARRRAAAAAAAGPIQPIPGPQLVVTD
jgi:hypothetical protein